MLLSTWTIFQAESTFFKRRNNIFSYISLVSDLFKLPKELEKIFGGGNKNNNQAYKGYGYSDGIPFQDDFYVHSYAPHFNDYYSWNDHNFDWSYSDGDQLFGKGWTKGLTFR